MDLSAAITNGYNIGKDLGYNLSGQAAEDRRLNREMTRAKIDTMQAQADLAQQQAQYARDDREEQEKMKGYEGIMTLTTQAIYNPLMKPQALNAINNFKNQYGYSNEWVVTDALDDDLRDPEKFNAAAMLAYTVHGKGTNPEDEQNADDFQRVQQGIVKLTNTQTGETQYAHIGDLLYMFGGNYGTAYMHSVIQAKKLKEEAEREKAKWEIKEKQFNMANKAQETDIKARKQAVEEQNYLDTINMHNKLDNYIQNNPNEIKSVSTKDGKYTGYTKYNPDDGTPTQTPEEFKNMQSAATNELAKIVQTDGNSNLLYPMSAQELRQTIENYINARPIVKNAAEQKSYDTTHFEPMVQAVEKLYELEAAGVKGATERRQVIESALSYFDEQFGAGKNADIKLSDRMAGYNSMARSGNIISQSGGKVTGFLPTVILNAEDFFNTPRDSDEFRQAQDALNALINDYMINLSEVFNGRLTNKVLNQLRPTSQWRSFITNVSRLSWVMNRLADRAEQDAKIASPSQAGQARFVAKKLRQAVNNLEANVRLETKLLEGKVNDMNVLDAKNGSLEKAAQASQSNDTIYFDGKGSVYIIPQNPDKTLDNYKFSMKEFTTAIEKNGKSQNWLTSWIPGVKNKTAWSQFTN